MRGEIPHRLDPQGRLRLDRLAQIRDDSESLGALHFHIDRLFAVLNLMITAWLVPAAPIFYDLLNRRNRVPDTLEWTGAAKNASMSRFSFHLYGVAFGHDRLAGGRSCCDIDMQTSCGSGIATPGQFFQFS